MIASPTLERYLERIDSVRTIRYNGKVTQVVGLTLESHGPIASIGELCKIHPPRFSGVGTSTIAEVVGFHDNRLLLMPLGSLDAVAPGSEVESTGSSLTVSVSESILGRVLDGLGRPIDGLGPIVGATERPVDHPPPNPFTRPRILEPLSVGVKCIDGLLTVGRGQRVGLFAGSGVGKSTLLGMMARGTEADVNVIALIGERGREVKDFIERDLGPDALAKSVCVVATSDQPPLVRIKGALVATSIAEFFRDRGYHVNLMMDSVTRFAMAQREVGLAVGEPPTTKGYTPSVFALLPRLLERAGTNEAGTITGFYTVLVDGDDMNEPIADAVRGILDGHFVLSRKLANKGQYPAIDILQSVSRVMPEITGKRHKQIAAEIKKLLAVHQEAEDLISIGAYQPGTNKSIDRALENMEALLAFQSQETDEVWAIADTVAALENQFGGLIS